MQFPTPNTLFWNSLTLLLIPILIIKEHYQCITGVNICRMQNTLGYEEPVSLLIGLGDAIDREINLSLQALKNGEVIKAMITL